jgi:hypothetical protein
MKQTDVSEVSTVYFETTRLYNPESYYLNTRRENLKRHNIKKLILK